MENKTQHQSPTEKVCVAITLIAKEGKENDVKQLFTEYIPLVEKLPGVIKFELQQSIKEPRKFLLYELYDNYEALTHHRNDKQFAEWRPRIAAIEESRVLEEFISIV